MIKGLTEVMLVENESNKFKIIECVGGYDRTAEFATELSSGASEVFEGLHQLRMRTVISQLLLVKVRFQLNHLLFCTRKMSNG